MSQDVDHLMSKGFTVVLHRETKDPLVFEGETLPDPFEEGRGDWQVTVGLSESSASQHMCST
jgi:hypothetical protein